jgi:hypothetical protein
MEREMSRKTTYLLAITIVAAAAAVPTTASAGYASPRLEAPTLAALDFNGMGTLRTTTLDAAPRRLAAASWWGGTYTVAGGQRVTVYVSATYPEADGVGRQWAEYFAALVHGAELPMLKAYVAPLSEVEEMCGSEYALGCYGGQTLITIGDSSAGYVPASIAAHEYGHHIAANRSNAPWAAIDWGTKRWASYMNICSRAGAGMVFPGDEGMNYAFNPGEGFAESYRVLIETNGTGAGYGWPIVDPSFRPDVQALAAIRADVLDPWSEPRIRMIRGRFAAGSRTWTTTVATPLDGDARVAVTVPGGGADGVTLLAADGRTVLGTGSWNSAGGKSLDYRICGARSLKVRVTRGAAAARFTLRVVVP